MNHRVYMENAWGYYGVSISYGAPYFDAINRGLYQEVLGPPKLHRVVAREIFAPNYPDAAEELYDAYRQSNLKGIAHCFESMRKGRKDNNTGKSKKEATSKPDTVGTAGQSLSEFLPDVGVVTVRGVVTP
ncbi:hypothetical protein K0M31_007132 [Melipona bicolor]|uniref:Uncharacterized protein n=1 Tax=Melipona bicolor TaxID=60889 RepID=A0AA40FRP3_9HYME|nr:hypothetical protein K0M31_007132 [Melipona bicolor]